MPMRAAAAPRRAACAAVPPWPRRRSRRQCGRRGRRGAGRCRKSRLLRPPPAHAQLFDSERDRKEAERRALVNFHSLPDWRTTVFESSRRRQMEGAQVVNKGYLYEEPVKHA